MEEVTFAYIKLTCEPQLELQHGAYRLLETAQRVWIEHLSYPFACLPQAYLGSEAM